MTKNTESLLVAFMKCAANSGGITTLPAQQFIGRHSGNKEFAKEVKKITNADVKRTFPQIIAARESAQNTGKFL